MGKVSQNQVGRQRETDVLISNLLWHYRPNLYIVAFTVKLLTLEFSQTVYICAAPTNFNNMYWFVDDFYACLNCLCFKARADSASSANESVILSLHLHWLMLAYRSLQVAMNWRTVSLLYIYRLSRSLYSLCQFSYIGSIVIIIMATSLRYVLLQYNYFTCFRDLQNVV